MGRGGLTGAGVALAVILAMPIGAAEPVHLAIARFVYVDTSGEVQDQTQVHEARLQGFMRDLGADLARSGRYDVLALACGDAHCAAQQAPEQLVDEARRQHARLLLVGGIHKESTLIEWAKAEVVDTDSGKIVYDRLLSFRGDSDEAWRRAESFLAGDIEAQHVGL